MTDFTCCALAAIILFAFYLGTLLSMEPRRVRRVFQEEREKDRV